MDKKIIVLDVREMLRAKQEPFQVIMETAEKVGDNDILELHATFRPTPLLNVFGKKGFKNTVLQKEAEHFIVQFYKGDEDQPVFCIDNRGLEPPQPMIRALELLDSSTEFKEGAISLEIWNERIPAFLIPELEERGFEYKIVEQGDDVVRVRIFRAK